MLTSPYMRLANNLLHEAATGMWLACLLVLFVLDPRRAGIPVEARDAITVAMHTIYWMLLVALFVVMATGILRTFYWRLQESAESATVKRTWITVQHIVYFAVFIGGTYWGWTML